MESVGCWDLKPRRRDPKGPYGKALASEIANFTGIDSPYEAPEAPDLRIDTTRVSAEDAAEMIVERVLDLSLRMSAKGGKRTLVFAVSAINQRPVDKR